MHNCLTSMLCKETQRICCTSTSAAKLYIQHLLLTGAVTPGANIWQHVYAGAKIQVAETAAYRQSQPDPTAGPAQPDGHRCAESVTIVLAQLDNFP